MKRFFGCLLVLAAPVFAGSVVINGPRIFAGAGTTFVSDTFTDTDNTALTSHTGETGATWANVTSYSGAAIITSNKAKGNSTVGSWLYASGSPATAEYDVQADVAQISAQGYIGVSARTSTSAATAYLCYWDHTNSRWHLEKVVSGSSTTLGTDYVGDAPSTNPVLKLQIRNNSQKVFLNGVERITASDTEITAAGKAGVFWFDQSGGSTGRTLDNFTATNP
jgi:hypothetical protein